MTNRAAYWQRRVTAWEASGLSQAEFCRRRRLKAVTFAWWKRQLKDVDGGDRQRGRGARRKAGAARSKPAFVEIAMPHGVAAGRSTKVSDLGNAQDSGYAVTLPCGTSIRLPVDFDVDRASQLIHAVARSC